MQWALSEDQAAFRDEVRAFLAASLPHEIRDRVRRGAGVDRTLLTDWTRILHARGWAAPAWPVKFGGTGWSLVKRHIFDVECRAAHAPPLSGFGFNMVGPAIIRFGTEAQQAEHLQLILTAERWWCQGYSEPEAGSDLAAVRTRAVRDGDVYRVTGQKIWTSAAEEADWIFCLVRSDPDVRPQQGISFLLIDLATPGIRIEPLYAFNGKRLWNQVFFDDVRVPVANRLGPENGGWTVAKRLLGDERLMVSRVAENRRLLGLAREFFEAETASGSAGSARESFKRRLTELAIRLEALESLSLRLLTTADAGGVVGAEPSMLKLKGSELVQAMDELLFELVGYGVLPRDAAPGHAYPGPVYAEYVASGRYHHRGYTIAGGSSEVQHNIIAKEVLGL